MSYVCSNPESYKGKVVGDGNCVAFVKEAAKAPETRKWKQGASVKGDVTLKAGTAIATFNEKGEYPNKAHGNHAAIYLNQDLSGLVVLDQWQLKGAVSQRLIAFRGGKGSPSDDGDAFSVIE